MISIVNIIIPVINLNLFSGNMNPTTFQKRKCKKVVNNFCCCYFHAFITGKFLPQNNNILPILPFFLIRHYTLFLKKSCKLYLRVTNQQYFLFTLSSSCTQTNNSCSIHINRFCFIRAVYATRESLVAIHNHDCLVCFP